MSAHFPVAWLQLKLDPPVEQATMIADLLSVVGALAVTLEDGADEPLYEPPPGATPLWSHTRVTALFEAGTNLQGVLAILRESLGETVPCPCCIEPVEDKDWERASLDSFHPLRFGTRLWVCPSWHTPPDPQGINLILNPGLAFGTGAHPTTALCLEWLATRDLPSWQAIDYGCGSGILALAAAKLGVDRVWAVDNDPQALQATRDNAAHNALQERIFTCLPEMLPEVRADLLMANILARPLIEHAAHFGQRVRAGGHILLSGILVSQEEDLMQTYRPWFTLVRAGEREGWVCLEGRRKSDKV